MSEQAERFNPKVRRKRLFLTRHFTNATSQKTAKEKGNLHGGPLSKLRFFQEELIAQARWYFINSNSS